MKTRILLNFFFFSLSVHEKTSRYFSSKIKEGRKWAGSVAKDAAEAAVLEGFVQNQLMQLLQSRHSVHMRATVLCQCSLHVLILFFNTLQKEALSWRRTGWSNHQVSIQRTGKYLTQLFVAEYVVKAFLALEWIPFNFLWSCFMCLVQSWLFSLVE